MTVDGHQRKAMKDGVPTVSKRRLNVHIRELTPADMRSVQHAIAIHWIG